MELQRYASIMLRESQKLLKLTGEYDAGGHNDQAIHEQVAVMRARLDELSSQLKVVECSQCHKPVDGVYTHTENGVKKNYCSYCYLSQFD